MTFKKWFRTFLDEKRIGSQVYEVASENGTLNMVPTEVVVEAIMNTSADEQKQIKDTLVKIDFVNGDVHHFFNHLAGALAVNLA